MYAKDKVKDKNAGARLFVAETIEGADRRYHRRPRHHEPAWHVEERRGMDIGHCQANCFGNFSAPAGETHHFLCRPLDTSGASF